MQASTMLYPYVISDKLGESLQASVFKGHHRDRPTQPVVLKLLKLLSSWEDQSRHLRQKVQRLRVLHDPRACTPLALESAAGQQFIVQPWFSGVPLDRWAAQQEAVSLDDFFTIACTLADTLQAVHDAGITHGGVKPHNILIQPDTLSLRLTDFITPLDIRDVSHFIFDPEFVRGTLAYTSPEQTGRINYRVDFSTDLYSLGIVLYELLTGTLPFFSTDPLALIHSHLAQQPALICDLRPALPRQLAQVVARLLLKQPEKRYQSAAGLLADLLRCRDAWAAHGSIPSFSTGLRDHSKRVIFISKMVGRLEESALIQREYAAVTQGAFRAVCISGFSGIGKTRLIQELQQPLVRHRGYFTSGKFDQYQKNIPYSSLIQALRNLMRIFLTESEAQVQQWRRKILGAVGASGRVITDVVPELEFIIGVQPEVAHLPPVEARNRFNNLFGRFLACMAAKEHPLVLFIDDLQWCDSATFDFLHAIFANHGEHPHLLFLGAYRHNEVDSAHPLTRLIRQISEQGGPLEQVRIGELNAADCHEMVAYILDSPLPQTAHLAAFIEALTEGNPLFVSESLAWLYNENLLHADEQHEWQWDMSKIRDTQMPASVVELFSSKVSKLPAPTLHILNYCACMGNRFTAQDVALVLGYSLQQLFEDLKPVLSLGMLLENKSDLQFVHDRVQEAVLRQVPLAERAQIHWLVGQRLLQDVPAQALEKLENLFTIAAHLNRGRPTPLDEETAYRLAQINFHAANKALDSLASDAANEFYRMAHDYLPPDSWAHSYELSYRVYQRLAKTELMCGRYEESERLLNLLIERAVSDLDKAEALAEQTTSLSSFGNFNKAIETANRGLAYFDKSIEPQPELARQRMQSMVEQIQSQGDVWERILQMPFSSERKSQIELTFYAELIPDLYMCGLVPQLYLAAAQSTLHCLQGGMDESVIYSFSIMGLNLGEQEQFEQAFRYEDLARELCAKHPNSFGATRGINGIVWCNMHSRSHPAAIVAYCLEGIQCGRNCGDLYNAGLSYGPLMWNLQAQGADLQQVADYAQECLEFSRKNQLSFSVGLAQAVLAGWVEPMKPDAKPMPMQDTLERWAADNYVAASGSYYVLLGMAHYFCGEFQAAGKALSEVERHLHGLTDNVLKRLWFVFRLLLRLRQSSPQAWPNDELEIAPWLRKIQTWASLGPLLRPYLALIDAQIARLRDTPQQARNAYLDAIAMAQQQGYGLLAGHLHELLADWLVECAAQGVMLGKPDMYYNEAQRGYDACKAPGPLARLRQRLGHAVTVPSDELALSASTSATLPNLDVNYLAKSALALSSEIDLAQLLQKIMAAALECSGAQHGYLVVKESNVLTVVAQQHVGAIPAIDGSRSPLEQSEEICASIAHYVLNTRVKLILGDAGASGEFQSAPEVQGLGLKSVLCLPLLQRGEVMGVLYLENRLAVDVFTPDRSLMTELLAAQAAISLEHARLLDETCQANQQLRIAATVFEAHEGMMVTDANAVILRVNRAFTELTGYSEAELVGQNPRLLSSNQHDRDFFVAMWDSIKDTGKWQGEIWDRRKNGEIHPQWLSISAVCGADGRVTHYVGSHADISLRKRAEQEISHLAFYDPLTQLPNRRLLLERLNKGLLASARSGREGALMFIDLDNFKTLNDTLGHDQGDRLLELVAKRLSSCVRDSDTVARLGGDEFVVVLEGLSENAIEAAEQAGSIGRNILQSLSQVYSLANQQYHCTSSIGVTLFAEHHDSSDTLLRRADIAMYQAKDAGRNTLRFFDPAMQTAVTARAALESDLRLALAEQQFVSHFQMQVEQGGRIVGAELLMRWQHPVRGMVAPNDFIGLAEELGLIVPMGLWILGVACAQLHEWAADPVLRELRLAVNVSARQFCEPSFVNDVRDCMSAYAVRPHRLKLEITESLVLTNADENIAKMRVLIDLGVDFSMDDFGTGYSSLSYLTRLPVKQLKIDRSFVMNIDSSPNDAAIVQTIIGMAKSLRMEVIAEGVETDAQRVLLDGYGCSLWQGYLFGKPVPIGEFKQLLASAHDGNQI